jgi:hypothetical protein
MHAPIVVTSTTRINPGTGPDLSWPQKAVIAAALAAIALFYGWTAFTSGVPVWPAPRAQGYSNHIARAFRAGQLNLLVTPRPELLALADPYDPAQNAPYRMHDAILFKNKYYLYYGPVPALLVFLPFRAITGLEMQEPPVVAAFSILALVFEWLLLRRLTRRYLPETPFWLTLAAVPALGFGNELAFQLRRPVHYEIALAAGQAFVFASAYCFVLGGLGERVRRGYLLLGSLLLGLAVGSRFPMIAGGLVPAVLAASLILTRWKQDAMRSHLVTALCCFAPFGACVFLLGLYNYLRFDSWTQFGLVYTLQDWRSARTYPFISFSHVAPGLYYYLLVPVHVVSTFPFFFLDPTYFMTRPDEYFVDVIGGLLPVVPLVGILLFAPAYVAAHWRRKRALFVACATSLGCGLAIFALYVFWAATMRYETDFATFVLIPSLLLWFGVITMLQPGDRRRRLVAGAFVVLCAATVTINAAISITGPYNNLYQANPATYEAIHGVFRPLERFFSAF